MKVVVFSFRITFEHLILFLDLQLSKPFGYFWIWPFKSDQYRPADKYNPWFPEFFFSFFFFFEKRDKSRCMCIDRSTLDCMNENILLLNCVNYTTLLDQRSKQNINIIYSFSCKNSQLTQKGIRFFSGFQLI